MPAMTESEVDAFIEANVWVYAKTMPANPHWYVFRGKCSSAQDFSRFAQHIRDVGKVEPFFKTRFIYMTRGEFKYWTMGNPISETTIINRARFDSHEDHRTAPDNKSEHRASGSDDDGDIGF